MKKILQFFQKKPKESISKENKLIITVNNNGKIFVNFDINDFSAEQAKNYGLMLYCMNEGFYVQTILDLFSHFAKQDSTYSDFMDKAISSWSSLISDFDNTNKEDIISNNPIISPSEFYKKTGYVK